jgi:hypothetical protein
VPIAEIRPVAKPAAGARPIGLHDGELDVPQSFFAPLPDEVVEGFEGRNG